MKKVIIYILFIILSLLSACYTYYRETNKKGVSKFKSGRFIFTKNYPRGSYASDGKFVKNVDLIFLHDTISKRCFTSYELENLKKIFINDTLLKKEYCKISPSSEELDMKKCIGLFYIDFPRTNTNMNYYVRVPLIKLQDTIFVNGISGIEIDESTKNYIEKELLTLYDSLETNKRINIFMNGRLKGRLDRGYILH